MLLVTGAQGLVGTNLVRQLRARGVSVCAIDSRAASPDERLDIRDAVGINDSLARVDGVVHLAAVSRVVWAERDPDLCWEVNVQALSGLLTAASKVRHPPWIVFASSREVYGQAAVLPVTEDAPLRPLNTYARSKVEGERLCTEAGARGLRVAVVRLSNVYGSASDHPDRVIPAFLRAAIAGRPIRVEGAGNTFDFTHIDDVVLGIEKVIASLESGVVSPPFTW